jgi:hypothetical protein
MNFFTTLLSKRNLKKHDGRPLWKYLLNAEELNDLIKTLKFTSRYNLDPRDVALYYAQWWKRNYNGGIPSKEKVFESLEGNIKVWLDEKEFFKIAKKGAQILGVKWIEKQNTLYFKTLLLQGGLPLKHIAENQSSYKAFLEAVLEEQPETIEDFIFKTHIIDLLPKTCQNDIVYENCFEIVRSILNDDNEFKELLESEDSLRDISTSLKIKRASLQRKVRQSKPKNYWLLSFKNDICKIHLRLGLADKYTKEALSDILGFEATARSYQFYMDDRLICIFRKMANSQFQTDWYNQVNKEWDASVGLLNSYVIVNNEKVDVEDFIQITPNLEEPSLWSKFNDNEWRLIKGFSAANKEAAMLFPRNWHSDLLTFTHTIYEQDIQWLPFEGERILESNEGKKRTYLSGVNSFDWVIQSRRPKWMLKANLPVVQGVPKVYVYDDDGYDIQRNQFKVYARKHNSKDAWDDVSNLNFIRTGCFDLKIEKGDLKAYDVFYNIGNLQADFSNQTIFSAKIKFKNPDNFEYKLCASELIQIKKEHNYFDLNVNTSFSKIPTVIKGTLGYTGKKKLLFDLISPFQGMTITDKEGQIIEEDQPLSISNIYGMRILCTPNHETLLKIKNSIKSDVIITKEIKESTQPVISFKDEIVRLFYLADAMEYTNTVTLELSEGREKKSFKISGFSNTLDVSHQLENKVSLLNSDESLELFAVPLNCASNDIEVIPLMQHELSYSIPVTEISKQFIIISSKKEGNKLMPRFVNTGDFFLGIDKIERIDNFHSELLMTNFHDDIWQQVLAYFNICFQYDIPFSTFDQLRAISRSSEVASRAFLFLGYNQSDPTEYVQKAIPEIEKDLGICFHWITKIDWENSIVEINKLDDFKYYNHILELVSSYMGENGLQKVFKFICGLTIEPESILQRNIIDLRSQLGVRVLNELPYNSPKISDNYHIQIEDHKAVRLLLQAPIAVAESIANAQNKYTIWGGDEKREVIRRNIQYSHYLKPDFYNKIILHVLKRS